MSNISQTVFLTTVTCAKVNFWYFIAPPYDTIDWSSIAEKLEQQLQTSGQLLLIKF